MAVDSDLAYGEPGQFANADDAGTSDPTPVTTRVPDSPDGFVDFARRLGAFSGFADGKFIDNEDKARQLEDPTNKVMAAMTAGLGRYRDTKIISGLLDAPMLQDNNQNYLVGAANANIIAAADATAHGDETIANVARNGGYGLTVGKLIEVKTQLDNGEMEEPAAGDAASGLYFACTGNQIQDLLLSIPVTSKFYSQAEALVQGSISNFMGFNFIRLPTNAKFNPLRKSSFTRKCVAWNKRAVIYRGRPIITSEITKRADKSFRWYAYYEAEHAAFRRYDEGVWEVDCNENTTGFN
jgi:hypothetical protein